MFQKSDSMEVNHNYARSVGKAFIDLIIAGEYDKLADVVDEIDESWGDCDLASELREIVEGYKEDNEVDVVPYDTPFEPIVYKDGSCSDKEYFFHNLKNPSDFQYDLELRDTDLTLMFLFIEKDGMYRSIFLDIHVM